MAINFGNFDFSNIDLSGLDADYFANLANTAAPTESVAPIAPAAPAAPVEEVVSLDSSFNEEDSFAIEQPSIDLNKQIATNKYGGALKYSELSPEDQAVVDARRAASIGTPPTTYQGVVGQDYGVGQQYETPEEALSALPSYLGSLEEQRAVTDKEFNRLNYDPSEFVSAGFSPTPGSVSKDAALDSTIDYITKNKIPLSKEVDGQTRYLTTGLGTDVFRADEDFDYKEGSYEAQGPVGTYSTVHVPPESVFDSPLLNVVGMFVPQVALMTTALKVAAGEKITPMEIVGASLAGLEYAGAIKAPTGAAAGGVGPVDTQGVGLLGTTYKETETLMKAAAADNLEGGVVQVFAPQVIDSVMSKVPSIELPETGLPEDFEAGLVKTVEKLAGGSDFDDALKAGGIEFIKEGGLKPLESIVKEAVKPVGDILEPIADALKTVTEPTKEFLSEADTFVRKELSEFDKQIQPLTKPVGGFIEDIAQTTGDVVEDVAQATGDVLSAADTAVRDALPDIDLPSVDLPDISLGMLTGGFTLSPTRTTDDIFKEDLFKLKTKIGVSPVEQLLRTPQAQQQEVVGLYDDPFASSFDERNTFQL